MRADHLSSYGYSRPTTPHFDAVAKDWVLFEHGVSPSSWTLPAMTSQFTARYPSFHGAVTEAQGCDRSQRSVFEVLADQGFTVLGLTGNVFTPTPLASPRGSTRSGTRSAPPRRWYGKRSVPWRSGPGATSRC